MSDNTETNGLHLPSLSIRGFRGINHLNIERLGRVTLLTGRNGIGKTTVLEAVRLYATRGHVLAMREILLRHEEVEAYVDGEAGQVERPMFETLFHGRTPQPGDAITVESADRLQQLMVEVVEPRDVPDDWIDRPPWRGSGGSIPVLRISVGGLDEYEPVFDDEYRAPHAPAMRSRRLWRGDGREAWPNDIGCALLGPDAPDSRDLADSWDRVGFTSLEAVALGALELATRSKVYGAMAVARSPGSRTRRMIIKDTSGDRVPLRSLGDGAVRTFGTAVGLADAAGGLLLIDEAENGIHHTLQHDYWRLLLRAAREFNVQVLATTHSWDCVAGFARAAGEDEASEGAVVRLEPRGEDGSLRAVEYSEDDLEVAATQSIEVR